MASEHSISTPQGTKWRSSPSIQKMYSSGLYPGEMRYQVVEGLLYYYQNETISVGARCKYVQPVAEVDADYNLVNELDTATWTPISDTDFDAMLKNRSPTVPTVAGAATIVLSPHTIPNWNAFDDGTGQQGLNPIVNPEMSQSDRARIDVEGQICPPKMATYRVDRIGVQVIPLATDVDYSTLLDKDDVSADKIIFKALKKGVKTEARKLAQQQQPRRQQRLPQLKAGPTTNTDERNANTNVNSNVVYGSTITFQSTGDGNEENPSTNPLGITPIHAFPWYYNGTYSEIISYVENPNLIWTMRYADFIGGGRMNIRNNVDSISFTIDQPKPFMVAKTIDEVDKIKGRYENDWVNVLDENVSYGAIAFAVPKAFRNVVSTRPYIAAVPADGDTPEVPAHLGLSPKNIGFCYISWTFTFRTK